VAGDGCRQPVGAVRAGDPLTRQEITILLARLEQTDVNRYCPHGRPIVIHLPVAQLERDFHRR
jgi:DNA mismatch repair protein MutL